MRLLFIHQNFPGQFLHLLTYLAKSGEHQLVGLGEAENLNPNLEKIAGLKMLGYPSPRKAGKHTHAYLQDYEAEIRRGQAVARAARKLKLSGFSPDVILVHPGWGEALFLHEVFPAARQVHYCEFFYNEDGADVGFDPEFSASVDSRASVGIRNSTALVSFLQCDQAVSPTLWQRSVFPDEFHHRIQVLHDGIDTTKLKPNAAASFTVNDHTFRVGDPVITFATRNLEPYRGFHRIMRALPAIQAHCPAAHIIFAGGSEVSYSRRAPDGKNWGEVMCAEVGHRVDFSRVHFTGKLPYKDYQRLLQVSAAHLYFTVPFVLSWSMLEAMACGALLVGSNTAPVREVITHGQNGLLVDFFNPLQLATTLANILAEPKTYQHLRQAARSTVQQRYDLQRVCLPQWLDILLNGRGQNTSPAYIERLLARANTLQSNGHLNDAEALYSRILQISPQHLPALFERGNVRQTQNRLEAAEADFKALLAASPEPAQALRSLGILMRLCGKPEQGIVYLQQSLEHKEQASTHWDLAFILLLLGRYQEAWPHFKYRHEALGLRQPIAPLPRWQPGMPAKTLLLLDEQGIGDTLQFLRFIPLLPLAPGTRLLFAGKHQTLSVVRQLLPVQDVFSTDNTLPQADAWLALMDMPSLLGIAGPAQLPPPLVHAWVEAARLLRFKALVRGDNKRPVVALVWRGNPHFKADQWRSPGLQAFRSLLELNNVRYVAVQVGPGRSEITELGLEDQILDMGAEIEAGGNNILDTLAILSHCDYVVSSCTSVVHMAGLLNLPGQVLLSWRADWRWGLEQTRSPWYPSFSLVRQTREEPWASVLERSAMLLMQHLQSQENNAPQAKLSAKRNTRKPRQDRKNG